MLHSVVGTLLVANAVSLGWGLRGEWGHWWGATVPGALCGMALLLVFGDSQGSWQMMTYGSVLALALSLGGIQSYGLIVGYATSERRSERGPLFGLFGLFLVGGLWGFWGGIGLGLLTSQRSYPLGDLALWAVLASLGAFLCYKLLVIGLDLHLSPPRSDAWAALLGGAAATSMYFVFVAGDWGVLGSALVGWVGFGGGFSLGAFIHRRGEEAGWRFSSWKFMEHSVGFFGGLALAVLCALRGRPLPSIGLYGAAKPSVLLAMGFVTYMVLSNNFEHWSTEALWFSRRFFALFQAFSLAVLACFFYVIWSSSGLLQASLWGERVVFLLFLMVFTVIGTLKFVHRWSDTRSRVVATFVAQFLICVVLVLLL